MDGSLENLFGFEDNEVRFESVLEHGNYDVDSVYEKTIIFRLGDQI